MNDYTKMAQSINGPDFICGGMSKSATEWLYDCFIKLDDFAMPSIKEFHHFEINRKLAFLNSTALDTKKNRLKKKVERFKNSLGGENWNN